ncbi:hypothetical protein ACI79C_03250 [Geodermatophilus sp. SYSU D00697]
MSRTPAAVLAILLTAACTAGDDVRPDDTPPLPRTVLATVDLDDAVGTDVVYYDLAPSPDGPPVALVGAEDAERSWLVRLAGTAAPTVDAVPAVAPDSRLVIDDDGAALIVSTELTRVTDTATAVPLPLGGPPTAVTLDGDTLYVARDTRLAAVDATTGAVRTTAVTAAPVTHLATAPDDGLVALVVEPRVGGGTGAALARLTPDLRPDGAPVELVPERVSTPTALQVTADGTAVATVYVGEALEDGRLVTVVDGRVRTAVDLEGTDDTALDLAVDTGGRVAYVVLSASYSPAELTAVDLDTGERTGVVSLCGGAGVFGAVAPSADGSLTVAGACLGTAGRRTTAFVVG